MVKPILHKLWVHHDRDNGITSVIKFVRKKPDGNYLVAVARGYMSPTEKMYSPGYGKKSAYDRMHRFMKHYNFSKNIRRSPYVVTANPYGGRKDKAAFESLTVFFVGGESLMTTSEMAFWHERALPCIEKALYEE